MNITLNYQCDDPAQKGEIRIIEAEPDKFRVELEFDPPVDDKTPNPCNVLAKFIECMTVFGPPIPGENNA